MKACKLCPNTIPVKITVDGQTRNLQNRKYCLICSPFGAHNTKSLRRDDKGEIVVLSRAAGGADFQCSRCRRGYTFDKRKGHTLTLCNSCNANRQRVRVKEKCVAYKGGTCDRCGYSKCVRALSFHHRDPDKKEFTISQKMSWSWDRLKAELDKCDMVCANCHMEVEDSLCERPIAQVA